MFSEWYESMAESFSTICQVQLNDARLKQQLSAINKLNHDFLVIDGKIPSNNLWIKRFDNARDYDLWHVACSDPYIDWLKHKKGFFGLFDLFIPLIDVLFSLDGLFVFLFQ